MQLKLPFLTVLSLASVMCFGGCSYVSLVHEGQGESVGLTEITGISQEESERANALLTEKLAEYELVRRYTPPPIGEKVDRTIMFAGHEWNVRNHEGGPGPNAFDDSPRNVWVDAQGRLHLRVVRRGTEWRCAEIYSVEDYGYGSFTFYLDESMTLNPAMVLNIFTWDQTSFEANANTEIGIQVSQLNEKQKSVLYRVEPIEADEKVYRERQHQGAALLSGDFSTHTFTWTESAIRFVSLDHRSWGSQEVERWVINGDTEERVATQGPHQSQALRLPTATEHTKLHFSLSIDRGRPNRPDINEETREIIIRGFDFRPIQPSDEVLMPDKEN